jgi:hypothetical protein
MNMSKLCTKAVVGMFLSGMFLLPHEALSVDWNCVRNSSTLIDSETSRCWENTSVTVFRLNGPGCK